MMLDQIDHPPLIVDSFAGGGGASTGIEMALAAMSAQGLLPEGHGVTVDIAINHDDAALAMHAANHPATLHLPANVWQVSLKDHLHGRRIGILWMSPDCRHHSKAKGGAPVSRSVRDLAWVAMRWLKELSAEQLPWMICLENVEEFQQWGPVMPDGAGGEKPDPSKKGETFRKWVGQLKKLGYSVDWRELRGCDYGAPTIRNRLYLVARKDGKKIVWQEPTHGDPKSETVKSGKLKPWPTAANRVIDWSRPCPSIFLTKDDARAYKEATGTRIIRPLAFNTMARIAKGVKRYVLDAAEPFVVGLAHGDSGGRRWYSTDEPLTTVHAMGNNHALVAPSIVGVGGRMGQSPPRSVEQPWQTMTTKPDSAIVAAHLMTMRNSQKPFQGADEPTHSVTAGGAGLSLVEAEIAPFVTYGQQGGLSRSAEQPLHTVTASRKDTDGVAAVFLAQHNGDPRPDGSDAGRKGRSVDEPMPTITTRGTQTHQVAAFLAQHNTDVVGHDAREPLSTIVGKGSTQNVVAAHMLSLKGSERRAGSAEDPHLAITAKGQHSGVVTLPMLSAYYGNGDGAPVDEPLRTATTKDRFGLVEGEAILPPLSYAQLSRARQVADFLREHGCWDEREFVTVTVRGAQFIVADIGMRMLTSRELARAQGFPESTILRAPFKGGFLSDTEQRHKIGNSVCPDMPPVLIVPNYRPPAQMARAPSDAGPLFMEAAE